MTGYGSLLLDTIATPDPAVYVVGSSIHPTYGPYRCSGGVVLHTRGRADWSPALYHRVGYLGHMGLMYHVACCRDTREHCSLCVGGGALTSGKRDGAPPPLPPPPPPDLYRGQGRLTHAGGMQPSRPATPFRLVHLVCRS